MATYGGQDSILPKKNNTGQNRILPKKRSFYDTGALKRGTTRRAPLQLKSYGGDTASPLTKMLGPTRSSQMKQLGPMLQKQQAPVQDNTQYLKTLQDFMQQARDILGSSAQSSLSSTMSGIAGREAAMKAPAADSTAKIGRGYQALNSFFNGNAPKIDENYQTAQNQVAQAATDTNNLINTGNQAAQAQQNALLKQLGIGDTNIVLQNKGTTNEAQQAANVADAAQRAQGTRNMLATNQATTQDFNRASGSAAQLEGQGAQNGIQRSLMDYLGKLQDERTQAQQSSQVTEADVVQLAQQLLDADQSTWQGNYDRRYQVEQDAANNAAAAYEAQMKAAQGPEMTATQYSSLGPGGQVAYALQQSGVDPTQARTIADAAQRAYSTGNVRNAADFIKLVQQYASGTDPIEAANAASIWYNYYQ